MAVACPAVTWSGRSSCRRTDYQPLPAGHRPRLYDLARIMCYFMRRPVQPPSRPSPAWRRDSGGPDQVKPTFRSKCPSLRLRTPPPAQCTMNASRMMARITTTIQKRNTTMPGMAYPATVLALATAASYPPPPDLFGGSIWDAPRPGRWAARIIGPECAGGVGRPGPSSRPVHWWFAVNAGAERGSSPTRCRRPGWSRRWPGRGATVRRHRGRRRPTPW
jgi:hypothetical protein